MDDHYDLVVIPADAGLRRGSVAHQPARVQRTRRLAELSRGPPGCHCSLRTAVIADHRRGYLPNAPDVSGSTAAREKPMDARGTATAPCVDRPER